MMRVFWTALFILVVAGCAPLKSGKGCLECRIREYWSAKVKGDLTRAYGYETPSYRKIVPEDVYVGRHNPLVRYEAFELKDVKRTSSTSAEADVRVRLKVMVPGGRDGMRITIPVKDRWVNVNGVWYHVPKLEEEKR